MNVEEDAPGPNGGVLQPMLVDVKKVAFLLGISRAAFLRLHACERTPRAIKLGARTLWRVDEIRDWVAAGCPARERWEIRTKGTWDVAGSAAKARSAAPRTRSPASGS